jgi:hypothetical protein
MAFAERLESLNRQHRNLELEIHDLETHPSSDEAAIKRLKIEKLALKDMIERLTHENEEMAEAAE